MKLLNYQSETYGIGSNPGGGIMVKVQAENEEEEKILEGNKYIYKRLTSNPTGKVPIDGGKNPLWDRLEKYLGIDPIQWAKYGGRTTPCPHTGKRIYLGDANKVNRMKDFNPYYIHSVCKICGKILSDKKDQQFAIHK